MNLMTRVLVIALLCAGTYTTQSLAQTTPTPANPQNPSTQSLLSGVDPARVPAGSTTPQTIPSLTAIQGVASIASSSRPGSLRTAGRGLPGMAGGPPIRGPLGYQDPASRYMQPLTLGPLLCDPLVDGLCE
jgi:hypothetical protein